MALYFQCRTNKNALLQTAFFGNFAHWETRSTHIRNIVNDVINKHSNGTENVCIFFVQQNSDLTIIKPT